MKKITFIAMRLTPKEGVRIPYIYGFTYYDAEKDIVVCHIIPLNIIIAISRWLYAWILYRFTQLLKYPND